MTTFNFYFLLLQLYPLPSPLHFGEYIPLQIVLVISLYSILPTLIPKKTTFHSNPSYDQLPTYNGDHLLLPKLWWLYSTLNTPPPIGNFYTPSYTLTYYSLPSMFHPTTSTTPLQHFTPTTLPHSNHSPINGISWRSLTITFSLPMSKSSRFLPLIYLESWGDHKTMYWGLTSLIGNTIRSEKYMCDTYSDRIEWYINI